MKSMTANAKFILAATLLIAAGLSLAAGPGSAAAVPVEDLLISDAVEDEMNADTTFSSHWIDVSTKEGVVTLSGMTDNILSRERAARIAETVKGVRAVVNTIEVAVPASISDKDIQADVEKALLVDPATDSYEVSVGVKDNVVTLSGEVDSWKEKELCGKVAMGVKGVKDVRNEVIFEYNKERPDEEIRQDIAQALRWDVLVDHALITVVVENGNVELSGTVGSLAEKSRASANAYVSGVRSVDAENLDVRLWARDPSLKQGKYENVSDEAIAEALEDAFLDDPRLAPFRIQAEVARGVVTLRGRVDNLKAKDAAAQDARNTVGVVRVKNRLKVRPKERYRDDELEENIQLAINRDPDLALRQITINVRNGVADLFGAVDNFREKMQARDLASRINGVIAVRNHLAVTGVYSPYPYDPFVEDWYAEDLTYPYEPMLTFKSDQEIQEEIEDELFWSPFVDGDKINVRVENGTAILTGKVDTLREYNDAAQNAREGGAVLVDNQLTVE